jgi:hypothetical protein
VYTPYLSDTTKFSSHPTPSLSCKQNQQAHTGRSPLLSQKATQIMLRVCPVSPPSCQIYLSIPPCYWQESCVHLGPESFKSSTLRTSSPSFCGMTSIEQQHNTSHPIPFSLFLFFSASDFPCFSPSFQVLRTLEPGNKMQYMYGEAKQGRSFTFLKMRESMFIPNLAVRRTGRRTLTRHEPPT